MSLEAQMKTALNGVAGGRVTPDVPKDNPVYPLVIYQQVGGAVLNPLECVVPDKDHARVQVWVWATTRLEASSIARQVRVALVEGDLKAYAYSAPVSDYNEALKLYGARCDYGIWYTP